MASAVVETQDEIQEQTETQTEDTANEQTDGTTKRKRVDVTTLDPNAKVTLSLQVPAGLKIKIRKAGEAEEGGAVSEAQLVRDLLAKHFEYEIPESFSERRGRQSQYVGMTEEQIKEAQKAENAKKRQGVNALLAAVQDSAADPEFAAKLAALGIDIAALPKPRKTKGSDDSDD